MSLLNRDDAFTIIWKIHNFSMYPVVSDFEESLRSAILTVDMLDKTYWYLILSSRDINGDKCLLCKLYRCDGQNIPSNITISYSIELLSIDSSGLKSKISHQVFRNKDHVELLLGNLEEIFNKKDILLPSDILTVKCCMWKTDKCNYPNITAEQKVDIETKGKTEPSSQSVQIQEQKTLINHVYAQNTDKLNPVLAEQMHLSAKRCLKRFTKNLLPNKCVIRTEIELERRSILWAIDKFSELKIGQKIFMSVLSTTQTTPLILALYLSDGDDSELRINIQGDDSIPVFVKCAITILDADREDRDCIQDARLLASHDASHLTLAKKNTLLSEGLYLKNDTLFLRCEFAISRDNGDFTVEAIVSYPEAHRFSDLSDYDAWKKKSLRVFKHGDFSDITLQIGKQSFYAHKMVLCASSTYFRNMFRGDFKEQKIEITNCEPGTLEKLLKYMYLGVVDYEMPLDNLLKLYSAAIEFRVVDLKRLCSYELIASLDVSNVCDVLNIADLHEDQYLKTAVVKFVSEFSNEVFHSSNWKNLMECSPKLTGNVMYDVLTNKYTL